MNTHEQMLALVARPSGNPGVRLPYPADLDEPWRTTFSRVRRAW